MFVIYIDCANTAMDNLRQSGCGLDRETQFLLDYGVYFFKRIKLGSLPDI